MSIKTTLEIERESVRAEQTHRIRVDAFIESLKEMKKNGISPAELSNKFYIYTDLLSRKGYSKEMIKYAISRFNAFK